MLYGDGSQPSPIPGDECGRCVDIFVWGNWGFGVSCNLRRSAMGASSAGRSGERSSDTTVASSCLRHGRTRIRGAFWSPSSRCIRHFLVHEVPAPLAGVDGCGHSHSRRTLKSQSDMDAGCVSAPRGTLPWFCVDYRYRIQAASIPCGGAESKNYNRLILFML